MCQELNWRVQDMALHEKGTWHHKQHQAYLCGQLVTSMSARIRAQLCLTVPIPCSTLHLFSCILALREVQSSPFIEVEMYDWKEVWERLWVSVAHACFSRCKTRLTCVPFLRQLRISFRRILIGATGGDKNAMDDSPIEMSHRNAFWQLILLILLLRCVCLVRWEVLRWIVYVAWVTQEFLHSSSMPWGHVLTAHWQVLL